MRSTHQLKYKIKREVSKLETKNFYAEKTQTLGRHDARNGLDDW
jgi:hypothetical protein